MNTYYHLGTEAVCRARNLSSVGQSARDVGNWRVFGSYMMQGSLYVYRTGAQRPVIYATQFFNCKPKSKTRRAVEILQRR
eukprot:scaffold10856_cov229-Amphora_coffeaeformis.AAC.24